MDPKRSSALVKSVLEEAVDKLTQRGTEKVDEIVKEGATRILTETQGMRPVERMAVFAAAFEVALRQYLLWNHSKSPKLRKN
ncbi:MAG: hypothetical protein ACREA0_17650 [bacterium]